MAIAYRTVDRYSGKCLDLEISKHPDGSDWRNWRLAVGALPVEIAEIRCDFGNGLISEEEKNKRELAWHRQMVRARRAKRAE